MSSSNEIQTNPGETSTPVEQPPTHDTTTINKGNDKEQPRECMCSWNWDLSHLCCKKKKRKEEGPSSRGQDTSYERRIGKLNKKFGEIERYLKILENFQVSGNLKVLQNHLQTLKDIVESETEKPTVGTGTKTPVWIPKISKEIMKFKQQISSTDRLNEKLSLSADFLSSTGSKGGSGVQELGNVHQSANFISSSFYEEIQRIFNGLCPTRKFLLSCFTVFPENAVVKSRIFVYWGLGEDKLHVPGTNGNAGEASFDASVTEDEPEKIVDRILEEFQESESGESMLKAIKCIL